MENKSRRDFVKTAALSTSGLLILPAGLQGKAYSTGAQKLKLALVGCGGRGTGAAVQALTADADVELVAMADAFEDRLNGSLNA
ncbi:MAG: twin-arginine translocation signal domain-containing protein, partial [Cytophagia bacterium]|nr:twin-arginine translocation signal domain-containing protein [Cytophagia bacterium]